MPRPLRALIVDDSEGDCELLLLELSRGGFEVAFERVDTAEAMSAALARQAWDIVFSDYSMPRFDPLSALSLLRAKGLDLPFIIASGTVGEEAAVEAMKAGAHNYFRKDKLSPRLIPVVERELREAAGRAERRRAEEALGRAEERYRAIFENAVVGIYQTTLEGRYVTANPTLARIYGYESPEELIASVADLNRQFYVLPGRRQEFIRLVEEHGTVREFESQVYRKDGSSIWISEDARALRDAFGRLVGFEGTTVDVTARKLAEEQRERLAAVLDNTPDFVAVEDSGGRLLYLNRAARRVLGLGPEDDVSRVRVAAGQPEWARKLVLEIAIPAAVRDGVWMGETAFVDANGQEAPFSQVILARRSSGGGGEFLSTIARDLSEQKSLEAQLRHAQKMEAIGQLAGGVAHDFNNILGVITGYGELALRQLGPEHPARARVDHILTAAQRAVSVTRQLLAFSRRQVLQPKLLDLNSIVVDTQKMLGRLISEDVELVIHAAAGLGTVKADPGQIEQIILNLAVNARDAMPKGGSLTLETANVDVDEVYAAAHPPATPGRCVMLAVADTGIGMDEQTRQRIFEPFFTTKPDGKGTGLGLATVWGIVKQSGGYICVSSEPGRGTTFKVYLPRVDEPAEAARPAGAPAEAPRGHETILLVEDTETLREVIRETLEELGYTVLLALNGEEALALAEERKGPIDLLLTDVVMPKLGGGDLAMLLSALRPEMRVLYMSGYTSGALSQHGVLAEGVMLLGKPFTWDKLARKVREALDAP